MRHIIPISGKDSLATAILQKQRQPDLQYEYFFNPTGWDLPESLEWIAKVEQRLGIHIERVGDDLPEIIRDQKILPSDRMRFCTRLAKIFPMLEWIGLDQAFVYYGIRADENRVGYRAMGEADVTPIYPLTEMGYTLDMVWKLVSDMDLMPPSFHWQSMEDMVLAWLGAYSTGLNVFAPWERAILFAWRSRPNCHGCFYQRLYEFVGLLEHHPDLFWQDEELEREIGAKDFSLKQNWPLAKIAMHAESIKKKRCIAICKTVLGRAQLKLSFEDENEIEEDMDMLPVVSCGLFCGK